MALEWGSLLEAHLGWRGAFWALGGTGLLFVPVIGSGLREPRREVDSTDLTGIFDRAVSNTWVYISGCLLFVRHTRVSRDNAVASRLL